MLETRLEPTSRTHLSSLGATVVVVVEVESDEVGYSLRRKEIVSIAKKETNILTSQSDGSRRICGVLVWCDSGGCWSSLWFSFHKSSLVLSLLKKRKKMEKITHMRVSGSQLSFNFVVYRSRDGVVLTCWCVWWWKWRFRVQVVVASRMVWWVWWQWRT